MKKIILIIFMFLALLGCSASYPFVGKAEKLSYEESEKKFNLSVKIIDEKSKLPEKQGFKDNDSLNEYFLTNIKDSLSSKNMIDENSPYNMDIKIILERQQSILSSVGITGIVYDYTIHINYGEEKIGSMWTPTEERIDIALFIKKKDFEGEEFYLNKLVDKILKKILTNL